MNNKISAAIMASGRGSNALNLLERARNLKNVEFKLLITDKEDAPIRQSAKAFVETIHVPYKKETDNRALNRENHEKQIIHHCKERNIEWIFLAGYMRLFSPVFIKAFHSEELGVSKILNIHPSLLPSFPGKTSYKDAFDWGVKVHGATIHFVDEGMDTGPIFLQESYPRKSGESFDEFQTRGLEIEYKLYSRALSLIDSGSFKVNKENESRKTIEEVINEGK